nr:MAG TPA: hypothetical protein [Caudoviricetes sp.]
MKWVGRGSKKSHPPMHRRSLDIFPGGKFPKLIFKSVSCPLG